MQVNVSSHGEYGRLGPPLSEAQIVLDGRDRSDRGRGRINGILFYAV